jgi:hypothetical protein
MLRKIKYICDKCGVELEKKDDYGIFIRNPNEDTPLKKYDLCRKCYKEIHNEIKKN